LGKLTCAESLPCCSGESDKPDQTPSQPKHCVCSFIQSGGFISEKSGVSMPLPNDVLFISAAPPQADNSVPTPASAELILVPPELLKSWQFFYRSAALPRAPAFVS
jgi:hypothetical protein